MSKEKWCEICGKPCLSERENQKYCTIQCRRKANRRAEWLRSQRVMETRQEEERELARLARETVPVQGASPDVIAETLRALEGKALPFGQKT